MSYHFAVFLQEQLNVPIGIISASWAGTGIESWLSYDLQASDDNLRKATDRWWKWKKDFPHDSIAYAEKLALQEENLAKGTAGRLSKNRKVFICWNDRIVSPVPFITEWFILACPIPYPG